MEKVTFLQNLMTTLGVFFSSSFFVYILASALVLGILRKFIIDSVGEVSKKFYYGYAIVVFSLFIIIYSGSILQLWDKLMDNLFLNIYFPTLEIYMSIIITSLTILIVSLLKKKLSKLIKTINIFSASSLICLFFLTLDTIVSSKVDMSSDMFLYTNSKLLALIEVSTGVFALWMIALSVIHGVKKIGIWFDSREIKQDNNQASTATGNKSKMVLKPENNYSILIKNLLEKEPIQEAPVKESGEKEFLLNEYKQMREYLMKVKRTNDNSYYMNNIMRDIFTR